MILSIFSLHGFPWEFKNSVETNSLSLIESEFIKILIISILSYCIIFFSSPCWLAHSNALGQEEEFVHLCDFLPTDGLVDCMDPDCCLQSSCQNQPYCRGLPDPQDIISQSQQSPSQQAAKAFYDRISFLIGADSTHVIPGESPFNKR